MNAGEVENPGAFDPEVNSASSTPTGEGGTPLESRQQRDPEEPIGDDGVNYDAYADGPEATSVATTNSAEMNFSAEDIKKRKKTNYFVNIAGAEKLKREEEKRRAAEEKRKLNEARRAEKENAQAEKAAAAQRARKEKYDASQEKNVHKEAVAEEKRQRKAVAEEKHKQKRTLARERRHERIDNFKNWILNHFWNGRKKIIPASILALAILAVPVYFFILNPFFTEQGKINEYKEEAKTTQKEKEDINTVLMDAKTVYSDAEAMLTDGTGFYDDAKNLFLSKFQNSTDEYRIYYLFEYASFAKRHHDNLYSVARLIQEYEGEAKTKSAKFTLYSTYVMIYSEVGDEEKTTYYTSLRDELNSVGANL